MDMTGLSGMDIVPASALTPDRINARPDADLSRSGQAKRYFSSQIIHETSESTAGAIMAGAGVYLARSTWRVTSPSWLHSGGSKPFRRSP